MSGFSFFMSANMDAMPAVMTHCPYGCDATAYSTSRVVLRTSMVL